MHFYDKTIVQIQNKVYKFHVSVLSILNIDFGDENGICDLLSFDRLIVFFSKEL